MLRNRTIPAIETAGNNKMYGEWGNDADT